MDSLRRLVTEAPLLDSPAGRDTWFQILAAMDAAFKGLGQCFAFLNCLIAQDVSDQPAKLLRGRSIKPALRLTPSGPKSVTASTRHQMKIGNP